MPRSDATRKALDKIEASLEAHAAAVMNGGRVPELTKTLCAALVAGLNYCTPALIEHRKRARELGADAEMLTQLWDSARSERYDAAQRAALAAAISLTREPRAMPPAVREMLESHYDAEQMYELLSAIALENYRNRMDNALAR
ncbi:MAG TPA: hypothetical protein VFL13_06525 [Candidatus Baltobacteraceae bacterium]|nr:hypothetical protein [Candidatus Baltobacteraceae bacterium]